MTPHGPGSPPEYSVARNIALTLLAILCAVGGRWLAAPLPAGPEPPGRTLSAALQDVPAAQQDRLRRLLEEGSQALLRDPRFLRKALSPEVTALSPDEARARGRQDGVELTKRGLALLDPAELDDYERLRLALATSSERVCAAMWSGEALPDDDTWPALASLSDADIRQWSLLTSRASLLALESTEPLPSQAESMAPALRQIVDMLPALERDAFNAAIAAGPTVPPSKACEAMKTVLRNAPRLEPSLRYRFFQALAAL